ncbi:MAG TPA: bi-domain-containing oxidoreductase [Candidatus Sulfotelmatobacter sp.]|jgi:predicted dehydrogenase/threonine dehydrogenase-like Zn-dependent dehydrogenase|nr:bi-domain-containing oxidoreductase [Candidatus Sulfotelmatobacter sp.]
MKQVFQDARSAEITVADVPAPQLLTGCVLVRTAASLVSAGTERASSEFASKNLLQKARMRPDLVREVLSKIGRDGLVATVSAVRSRLDQPSALGYSSAGTVVAVGENVAGVNPGDRVACAGVGHAVHAEFACVPRLLIVRIPSDAVSFDEAAFTTVGSVALHGIRTADAKLGDVVAVIGLGLLGQLTVQILKAAGCRVLGMDISAERTELALRLGADAVSTSASAFRDVCLQHSAGHGADSVLIAAQTASNDPVNLAGVVARNRAVIAAVGTVAMDIPRRTFYEKELDFRISRSYGPGRYDAAYEQKGIDYPIGYVRWTETRNMEAFLKLLADRKLDLQSLISHRFPITQAHSAYDLITGKTQEAFLGVLLSYPEDAHDTQHINIKASGARIDGEKSIRVGLLGTGSFAVGTFLPALKPVRGVELVVAGAANGSHARHAAEKFGFQSCTTDEIDVISNPSVNTVFITTRHHLHARQVITALTAGKHVFCEKPLCLNEAELGEIVTARENSFSPRLLMVGFNRRFAPLAVRMKKFVQEAGEPLALHYRVNAGFLPADHWLNDPLQGGGRILGEVCHFVDFLCFLTASPPVEVETRSLLNPGKYSNDNVLCSLRFADGSQATISYLANGDKSYSKERIEVFGGGSVAVLEDFRRLELIRDGKKRTFRSPLRQDKGHGGELEAFVAAIQSGSESPIPFSEIVTTMLTTFALEESRCLGRPVAVKERASGGRALEARGFDQAS